MYSFRNMCWVFVAVLIFAAATNAQSTTPKPNDSPATVEDKRSTIRGRVVYDDSGKPLRRVQVMIFDPAAKQQARRPLMGWTDTGGYFKIKNVPAGKYFAHAEAPGLIREWGPDQTNQPSVTVDGNSDGELLVRAKRGGAISGKVTYADGEPALNTTIQVLTRKDGRWVSAFYGGPYGGNQCPLDERGNYRIYGLAPGEYAVGVAEIKTTIEVMAGDDSEVGNYLTTSAIATTYYNNTTNIASANLISVTAGNEEKEINITIPERTFRSVSGVVLLRPDSVPVERARISLRRKTEIVPITDDAAVTNTDEQGRFTFDEVQDGSYTLAVTTLQPQGSRRGSGLPPPPDTSQKFVNRSMDVNVAGADVGDIVVEVSLGSRISGIVVVDGGTPLPPNLAVYAEPIDLKQIDSAKAVLAQPDGTFVLEGIPAGPVLLRISAGGSNTYFTKAVSAGKVQMSRGPLQVKEGEDIRNVRITISSDAARVSGHVVTGANKAPAAGMTLMFVPSDSEQYKSMAGRLMTATNAAGAFQLRGAPGEYLVVMFSRTNIPTDFTYEALRSRVTGAQRVVLVAGENTLELVAPEEK